MKYNKNPFIASQQAEIKALKKQGIDTKKFKFWKYYNKIEYNEKSNYIWLGPGWHWRENEISIKNPKKIINNESHLISEFYNKYILQKNKTRKNLAIATKGCESAVEASINYFHSQSKKKILYLIPTFDSHLRFSNNQITLNHLNEKWTKTIQNVSKIIKKENIGCILIVNPNNPAGIMYPKEFFKKLSVICNKEKIWLIEDGAYFLFASKKKQTCVMDYFDYSISSISSAKLFPKKGLRVGGLIASKKINLNELKKFIETPNKKEKGWLISRLNLINTNKKILKEYVNESYSTALKVKNSFIDAGLKPMFFYYEGNKKIYPVCPVMSFRKKGYSGKKLFDYLIKKGIINLFVESKDEKYNGVRVNTRAILPNQIKLLKKVMR